MPNHASLQQTVLAAILRMLRPMVRILLRHGISHAEFADLAKLAYVDVSAREFAVEGRKQSVSRICVLTGLHRKEVNRVREKLANDDVTVAQLGRSARVISGWRNDPEFCDPSGQPKPLSMECEASFASLVKRYSGDMPVRALYDELLISGSVSDLSNGQVMLQRDSYIPQQSDEKLLQIMGISAADLMHTIEHNLNRADYEASRLQLVVDYNDIPQQHIDAFKRFSQGKTLSMLKELDAWLADHRADSASEPTKRLGFGAYYFENQIEAISRDDG